MFINNRVDSLSKKLMQIGAILSLFAAVLITPVVSHGQNIKQGKKKPRFELTETTLRDWNTKLEWSRQKDSSPGSLSWYKALTYARSMNIERYGGLRDWRLPTREEILSLAEYAKGMGFDGTAGRGVYIFLQQMGLTHINDEHYWTQTNYMYDDRFAWAVDLRTGIPEVIAKSLYENVIVVRTLK